jgi:hypothetical protein
MYFTLQLLNSMFCYTESVFNVPLSILSVMQNTLLKIHCGNCFPPLHSFCHRMYLEQWKPFALSITLRSTREYAASGNCRLLSFCSREYICSAAVPTPLQLSIAAEAEADWDGIHQYFYNVSIFFLSFFYLFSKLLLNCFKLLQAII